MRYNSSLLSHIFHVLHLQMGVASCFQMDPPTGWFVLLALWPVAVTRRYSAPNGMHTYTVWIQVLRSSLDEGDLSFANANV